MIACLAAVPAHADLYRWVDPQTGSVKFSSYPPPWFGDQALELNAPATEVIAYQMPGAAKPAAPVKPSAAASRAQEVGVMETLRRGLEAQFGRQ